MPIRLAKDRPEIARVAQPVVGMETRDYIRRRSSLISRDRLYPEEISGAMPPKWQLPNAGHATEPTFKLARFDLRSLARRVSLILRENVCRTSVETEEVSANSAKTHRISTRPKAKRWLPILSMSWL